MSTLPRVRYCGNRPISEDQPTKLRLGPDGVSHYAGLQSCASPWACPTCASKIAAGRVVEVDTAVRKLEAAGGGAAMLTTTFAHTRGDRLADLLVDQQRAWELFTDRKEWRRAKRDYGLRVIRYREVMWGEANGWHPHFHVAFLTTRPLTEDERRTVEGELSASWISALHKVGRSGLTGIALRLDVWKAEDLADYLTKQGTPSTWGAAQEVAGGAFKKGRGDRLTAWDLLALAADGDALAYELWCEYEAATKGKRTNQWTPGLRRELLGADDEPSDEELADAEVGGEDVAGLFGPARRAIWAASPKGVALLEAAETSKQAAWEHLRQHAPPGSWYPVIDQADDVEDVAS